MINQLKPKIISNDIRTKILLSILLLFSIASFAHGDLTQRIINKSSEILKNPNNGELFFERGHLYQQHEEYKNAISDYLKAENLGVTNKLTFFRKSECYYFNNNQETALIEINKFIVINTRDTKAKKLKAKILFELKDYSAAVELYDYVIANMIDFRPSDIAEHCKFILAENRYNYEKAIDVITFGLEKLGEDTLTLRLKKLELLKASNQVEEAIEEYNYFIKKYNRKEYWYYKKAKYLIQQQKITEANINLQLAKIAIAQLDEKFKNIQSIIILNEQINNLEISINTLKS